MSRYPVIKRLLRVSAPHFVAGATWEKDAGGNWRCTKAAPILSWMLRRDRTETESYLRKREWKLEWVDK